MTNSKESTGSVLLFGGGLKHVAFDKNDSQIGVFLQGHYAPKIEYKQQESTTLGFASFTQNERYYEISTGLTVAKTIYLDPTTRLIPYGGVMLSYLKGKEEGKFTYSNSTNSITANGDIDGDGIFALVLGTDLKFESNLGIRFEGRFVNQSSLSVALNMSF